MYLPEVTELVGIMVVAGSVQKLSTIRKKKSLHSNSVKIEIMTNMSRDVYTFKINHTFIMTPAFHNKLDWGWKREKQYSKQSRHICSQEKQTESQQCLSASSQILNFIRAFTPTKL